MLQIWIAQNLSGQIPAVDGIRKTMKRCDRTHVEDLPGVPLQGISVCRQLIERSGRLVVNRDAGVHGGSHRALQLNSNFTCTARFRHFDNSDRMNASN